MDGNNSRDSRANNRSPAVSGNRREFAARSPEGSSIGESRTMIKRDARMRRVRNIRLLFLACLTVVAAFLGFGTHRLLKDTEQRLAEEQFRSITDRALDMSLEIANRKRAGIITLASILEVTYPDLETWPYIKFNKGGFEVMANHLINTSSSDVMSVLPIVTPAQLAEFEAFAAPLYPATGVTRVTGLDANLTRYNETDGETYWGSPNKIFTPFLYNSRAPSLFLANYHSIESRGLDLDRVIACSKERAQEIQDHEAAGNESLVPMNCGYVTPILDLALNAKKEFVPSSVLLEPIYPANNRSIVVGFITSTIKWHETLINVFSSEVSGVDCVVETETQSYTYEVTNGNIALLGQGNLHDRDFSHYGRSIVLNSPNPFYGISSPTYTLTLYPTQGLFDVYATRNPISAMVGAVCIVILTACTFFLYDFVVRKEFHHKDALDSARRQFVRFISHEVRTPLNAVCMGLQLQHDESERLLALVRRKKTTTTTTTTLTMNDVDSSSTMDPMEDKLSEMAALGNDILANATSAVDVLNDLLNYDKVESGTLSLELTVVKIWELIEHTFQEFHQQATFNDVNYVLDLSAFQEDEEKQISSASELSYDVKNRKVIGDIVRLVQVLRNLISNAIKFSKDKDTLTVRPSWKKNGKSQNETEITLQSGEKVKYLRCGDLQVEVQDTGHGMTKEQLNSLFREGVQFNVNELQAGQGSGLGLYIAKGILEEHGGSLSATSEGIGCGTIFTMTIPLCYIPDPPHSEQAMPPPMKRRNDPLEKVEPLQILVVDDSNMNRKLLIRLLSLHGHVCNQAEDGAMAVQSVKDLTASGSRYDAILMDYEMPVMDGPTAAKQIRALGSDSFIVGITGNLFHEDIAHFHDCGANLVLPKPLDIRVLMDAFVERGIVTFAV